MPEPAFLIQFKAMRYILFLFLFFSCRDAEPSDPVGSTGKDSLPLKKDSTEQKENNLLIVPGISIGKILLGANAATLEEILGTPASSDAAMGKAWLTWKGKKDEHNNQTELNIFTSYKNKKMDEKVVQLIRTTSYEFSTRQNIHVYSSLDQIRKEFQEIEPSFSYQHQDKRKVFVYELNEKGIAFEVIRAGQQQICIGIIVYERGSNLPDIYRTLQPGLETSF